MPDGSQNTSALAPTGASATTFADGTSETDTTEPDKVWPSYQPFVTKAVTTLPQDGLVRTITRSKSIAYQATTPPVIGTVVEQTVVNGNAPLISSFNALTKSYSVTTPGGRVGTMSVDDFGRPVTISAPEVDPITYGYDHGRLSSIRQGGRATTVTFWASGGTSGGQPGIVDSGDGAASSEKMYQFVLPNRLFMSSSGTAASSSSYQEVDLLLDAEGNVRSVQNGSFVATQTYTPVNLLETFQPSASQQTATTFSYNKDRTLEFIRQAGSRGIDFVYDTSTRQLVGITADGAQDATFGYYNSSTCSGCANGQLRSASRGATAVTLAYNGPLTTSETWSGAGSNALNGSVSWGYNSDLRATSETVQPTPAATGLGTVSYGYDPDGLATCASLSTCDAGAPNKLGLTYSDAAGALTDTSLGNTAEHFSLNEYGELASYSASHSGAQLLSITYDDGAIHPRDALRRVRRESDVADSTSYIDYEYNDQGALWKVSLNGALVNEFSYDERGNRTSVDQSGAIIASYDVQDLLLSYAGTMYSYWPNGERRGRARPDQTTDQYQYDTLGKLSEVATPYATVDYVVDALNRRIVKKKNGTPYVRYLYGSGSRIAAVLDSSGNLAARFVYASHPNTPDFMVLADGSVYRFFCDQLGSPRLIVNSTTGAIAQKISYDAFGTATVQTSGPFPAWQQPFGFAGGLYDEDTGLVRFGARDYDPEVGRWLARDPILFNGGQANLYVYAGNDPVNRMDPAGLFGINIGINGSVLAGPGIAAGGEGSYGVFWDISGGSLSLYTSEGVGSGIASGVSAGLSGQVGAAWDSASFWGSGSELGVNAPQWGIAFNGTTSAPGTGFGTLNGISIGTGPSLGVDGHYFETHTTNRGTWSYSSWFKRLLSAGVAAVATPSVCR